MALTDTFVRFAKVSKPSGDKHYYGGGLYIHVKPQGKYWRLDYAPSNLMYFTGTDTVSHTPFSEK